MHSMIRELYRRIMCATAYGNTKGPVRIGADGLPVVQVQLSEHEILDVRIIEQAGVHSNLAPGTPVHVQFQAGDRGKGFITGSTSPADRPAMPGAQDRALSAYGFTIRIGADGIHINAPAIFFDAPVASFTGDVQVKGEVTAGFGGGDAVTLSKHKHPTAAPGGPSSPTPGT